MKFSVWERVKKIFESKRLKKFPEGLEYYASLYKYSDSVEGMDFYGRINILNVCQNSNNNTYIIGLGRAGKSSFLKQIKYRIENEEEEAHNLLVAYIDFEIAAGTPMEIQEALTEQVKKKSDILEKLSLSHPFSNFDALIEKIAKTAKDKKVKVILLCDEIGQLTELDEIGQRICHSLMKSLKDNDYFKVIATSGPFAIYPDVPKYFGDLRKSFDTHYLKGLEKDDALRLCQLDQTKKIPIPSKIARKIFKITGGFPGFIQKLCSKYFLNKLNLDRAKMSLMSGVSDNIGLSDISELQNEDREILDFIAEKSASARRLSCRTGRSLNSIKMSLTFLTQLGLVAKKWWNSKITNEFYTIWLQRKPKDYVIKRLQRSRFIAWLLLAITTPWLLFLWLIKVIPAELNWLNPRLAIACALLMAAIIIFNLLDRLPNKLVVGIFAAIPSSGILAVIIEALTKFFSP